MDKQNLGAQQIFDSAISLYAYHPDLVALLEVLQPYSLLALEKICEQFTAAPEKLAQTVSDMVLLYAPPTFPVKTQGEEAQAGQFPRRPTHSPSGSPAIRKTGSWGGIRVAISLALERLRPASPE